MTAPTPDTLPVELPTDIGWGWLDWRLMFFDGDGGDADDAPDLIPAAGAIVTATPNVQLASHLTGTTFTAGKRAIHGIIDTQGRLCRKNSASGMPEATPGLPVIATDSAALTSQGFAYEITVSHPALKIGKFSTQVSAGERVDLAKRIGQSIPPGTQVTVLTPEIRAEIEKAVASVTPTLPDDLVTADELTQALAGVQVDTSGLATTEALQQVQTELGTKVDASALDEVERSIPEVVLREAPLVDGELIQSTRIEAIEQVDGSTALVLIQTTSTGREVTATIPTISAATITGDGSPQGAVNPARVGVIYQGAANQAKMLNASSTFVSTGATNTSWAPVMARSPEWDMRPRINAYLAAVADAADAAASRPAGTTTPVQLSAGVVRLIRTTNDVHLVFDNVSVRGLPQGEITDRLNLLSSAAIGVGTDGVQKPSFDAPTGFKPPTTFVRPVPSVESPALQVEIQWGAWMLRNIAGPTTANGVVRVHGTVSWPTLQPWPTADPSA